MGAAHYTPESGHSSEKDLSPSGFKFSRGPERIGEPPEDTQQVNGLSTPSPQPVGNPGPTLTVSSFPSGTEVHADAQLSSCGSRVGTGLGATKAEVGQV